MASRAVNYWRSMARHTGASRSLTSATTPKIKMAKAAAADFAEQHAESSSMRNIKLKAEYFPLYMILGFVVAAASIAAHTAKNQLMHSPSVQINKKKRETVPEVEFPDQVIGDSSKFLGKSFLRNCAHLVNSDSDRSSANPLTQKPTMETLKSVGVNPKRN